MAEREDNRWVTLVLVCLAQFMVILDATIVNIALPTIQEDLHFSQADLQWVVNSYTLLFGGFLLLGGRAADIVGRKKIFIAGTILFSVASLLNGLATSSGMLIAFRALQGLGAALVSPAALSIITTTFPEGPERTKALGVWSAIAAGGGAIGLLLGGILTEALSWEWIFFVNVPVGAATAILSARLISESKAERAGAFDVLGAVLVTAGLMVLVYAIVKAESFGWGSDRTLGLAAVGVALLAVFVLVESRTTGPLVRLGIFKIRSLAVANSVLLLVAGGLFALFFFATLYVQEVLGFKPIKAGFAFLPVAFGIAIGAGTAQVLIKKIGVRANAIAGMVVAAAGLFYLSGVPVDGTYVKDLLPGLLLMSFGMGNTFVPITLIATTNVEPEDAGLASGLFNTSQQVGGALGLAVLSTLAADRTVSYLQGLGHQPGPQDKAAGLVEGFQVAFTSAAILVTVGAILLAVLLRSRDVANVNPEQGVTVAA
ncbi:MFS transporter [Solirubrobacter ginsenosidimutans]|uniref:MFS transporter n=1 Tax=Solirubrobacter ginsenosidimutans TaxID=490573 RepID=A0A9X3MR91_9ACTN|nr:MFS transporter [Solirubrobacter ginsenosidimutans]MDA0161496.1 MFS transporter [Solirubrobacter ginsenosidimutans]